MLYDGRADDTEAANINAGVKAPGVTFVIDAGHGGIDGGAVTADGTPEKELNLAVASRLSSLMRIAGADVIMTRTDDRMLVSDDVKQKRKMHDLKNRLAIVNDASEKSGGAVLISIHMNKFSSPKYSGLQVWYSGNVPESKNLAEAVQSAAKTYLAPDNNRTVKEATSAIYLLDRAQVPAILIECGFLSNEEECARLKTAEYQTALAAVIFAAVISDGTK